MASIHTLKRQLLQALGLYQDLKAAPGPLDTNLRLFFYEHRGFGAKDRRVISSAVYGLTRHFSFIEAWQKSAGAEAGEIFFPAAALVCEGLLGKDDFRELLSIPDAEGIYDALCDRILPQGAADEETEALSLRYSFPLWFTRKWKNYFGADTEALLRASNGRAELTVRANALKTDLEALTNLFSRQKIKVKKTPQSPWGLKIPERVLLTANAAFRGGLFEIQDEGSQKIVLTLDPQPGETVWDACAGGGGKTIFAAALMRNEGKIIATDVREEKQREIYKRAKRAGAENIECLAFAEIGKAPCFVPGFDRILLDAPCSGTGTLRRNPENKWRLTPEKIAECAAAQAEILRDYSRYLKPGGVLVYATCSLEAEENENIVDGFLREKPEFQRQQNDIKLYPHAHGSDGFYMAKLSKDK